jgi:TPR repeat protein
MIDIDFQKFKNVDEAKQYVAALDRDFRNGSGQAGFLLHMILSEYNAFLESEMMNAIGCSEERSLSYCVESFDLLKVEADAGSGQSMHFLAKYYETGVPPVDKDFDAFKFWTDKAAAVGFTVVQDLLAIYADPKSKFYDQNKAELIRASVTH